MHLDWEQRTLSVTVSQTSWILIHRSRAPHLPKCLCNGTHRTLMLGILPSSNFSSLWKVGIHSIFEELWPKIATVPLNLQHHVVFFFCTQPTSVALALHATPRVVFQVGGMEWMVFVWQKLCGRTDLSPAKSGGEGLRQEMFENLRHYFIMFYISITECKSYCPSTVGRTNSSG